MKKETQEHLYRIGGILVSSLVFGVAVATHPIATSLALLSLGTMAYAALPYLPVKIDVRKAK